MGVRNYLIEGGSCTGKTAVCDELLRRGFHAVHGDRVLAYQGDPESGAVLDGFLHEHHIWDVDRVRMLVADDDHAVTFFAVGRGISANSLNCLMRFLCWAWILIR